MKSTDDIMKGNPLDNSTHEPCPRCESESTLKTSPAVTSIMLFLIGFGLAAVGVWLIFILIGIPIVLVGAIMMIAAFVVPFFKKAEMRCRNCFYRWPTPEQREKMESKENKKASKKK